MSVRYIFDTDGRYVAFISGENVFSPNADWLGVVREGNYVFSPQGEFLGQVTDDDRILRRAGTRGSRIAPPRRPLKPLRPLRPIPRLRKARLPAGIEDVFSATKAPVSKADLTHLNRLLETDLVAEDGTYLGRVTSNRFDSKSIRNQFGPHGSRFSQHSILNKYSSYGSEFSSLSPFNRFTHTPPKFVKNGLEVAKLSVNEHLHGAIHPAKFLAWLDRL